MGLHNISLKQLRYFAAAARYGRLSMAAQALHVSQSTITTAILQLETSLNLQLFQRQPHGVTLTAEGNRFYQRLDHILKSLEDAIAEPGRAQHDLRGCVRIAASYTLLGYFLPALLGRFRGRYPHIELDLRDLPRPAIEAAVLAGEIDMGVVLLSNMEQRERFRHHTLIRSPRQLWTAANHPLQAQGAASLAAISDYPFIQITEDEAELSTRRYWQAHGQSPTIAFRTSSMEGLRGLIAHGFGVTILSDMVYRAWSLEGKRIAAVPITDPIPAMEVGLIAQKDSGYKDSGHKDSGHQDTRPGAAAACLYDFLVGACQDEEGLRRVK